MADVRRCDYRHQTRFIALSLDAKKKFVEHFGDDIEVEHFVSREHGTDLETEMITWGLTIE